MANTCLLFQELHHQVVHASHSHFPTSKQQSWSQSCLHILPAGFLPQDPSLIFLPLSPSHHTSGCTVPAESLCCVAVMFLMAPDADVMLSGRFSECSAVLWGVAGWAGQVGLGALPLSDLAGMCGQWWSVASGSKTSSCLIGNLPIPNWSKQGQDVQCRVRKPCTPQLPIHFKHNLDVISCWHWGPSSVCATSFPTAAVC